MSVSPLDEIKAILTSDNRYRRVAARAIVDVANELRGQLKYGVAQMESQLDRRLCHPAYLGVAVQSLLESRVVKREIKVKIAQDYLAVVSAFGSGRPPKPCNGLWGGVQPVFVVETALF